MKKKLLSLLLASVTALTAFGGLAACDSDATTVTVWAPEEALPGFKSIEADFRNEHPEYADWKIVWEPMGEGDAKGQMTTNAKAGPNVFFIASDQLYELAFTHQVLQPLTDEYVKKVKERDVETAVDFATASDGQMYAFPATNDNCYFLWYDKTKLGANDVDTLDHLIAAAKREKSHILWNYETAFYSGMFYLGNTGLYAGYEDDAAYKAGNYTTNYNSDVGKEITKAMYNYLNPTVNGTGDARIITQAGALGGLGEGKAVAGIGGTWEKTTVQTALVKRGLKLEDTIDWTVLPSFTAGTQTYNLGSFAGPKFCGVNKLKSEDQIAVSLALADFLNSEKGQLARYQSQGSGPSNKKAMEDEEIKKDKILQTAMAQMDAEHSTIQGAQNDAFWQIHEGIAKPIMNGKVTLDEVEVTVDEAKALDLLATFAASLVAKDEA